MKLQIRQVAFLMLMPSWFFPSCIERTGIITALTTLCPSPCFPESHPQPFQPTLLPPPHPPLPQPQLPCPSPCLPPLPPAPPLPQPQLPCPLPSLPPAPPLPQLPCPSSCPPTPLPRLPCTSPMSTYQQPFTPQQPLPPSQPSFPSNQLYFQQNPYQPYQPSSQIPYAPNQQLPPPSYSTKPISIPQLIQQPASYSTPSGLSYGYGYGRQSSTYNTNPYYQNNPIPAKEKFIVEEKQEQQHERIKDPFEKIDDNDVENKSGDDDRTKTKNMRQRINPQLRDEAFYARPTTDISLPKPMPPIIYPTPIPMYQQQPPPLQTSVMAPAPIYQSSSFIQPYQQIQCPPCPIPTPQQIPIPSQPTPMQNCCLRCGAPCKSMALLKSYGVKTNPYLHGGVSSIDELSFHTKKMDEDKCNDNELAVILREALTLKMNLAKERIMERVEQRLLASTNVRTPNTHFHIVCAPRMLEYIIHAEKFCSGDVADGVCFVFKTG